MAQVAVQYIATNPLHHFNRYDDAFGGNPIEPSNQTLANIAVESDDDVSMRSGGVLRKLVETPQQLVYDRRRPTNNVQHPIPNTREYYCGICNKNFRGANEFKRHYSIVHEKKYRYKCIHCGKLWRDQYDLKRHCRRGHFYGRDIDKAFIRQCLLDRNTNNNNSSGGNQNGVVDNQPPFYNNTDSTRDISINNRDAHPHATSVADSTHSSSKFDNTNVITHLLSVVNFPCIN